MGLRICISNRFPNDAAAPARCLGDSQAAGGGRLPIPYGTHTGAEGTFQQPAQWWRGLFYLGAWLKGRATFAA